MRPNNDKKTVGKFIASAKRQQNKERWAQIVEINSVYTITKYETQFMY